MGNSELFESSLKVDKFIAIAENMTKYYLELKRNYSPRFNNEVFLLAAAGFLDAQTYVYSEQTIKLSTLVDMARTLASAGEDALIDYVTLLEMIILKVDHRNINTSEIGKACIGKKEDIAKTVQRIKKEYQSEPAITSAVSNLMNSPLFASYRRVLGISD